MKLNRNFIQISSTAIITSLLFLVYLFTSKEKVNLLAINKSGRISKHEADLKKGEYYNSPHGLRTLDHGVIKVLEAFVFTKRDIDSIIHFNTALPPGQEPDSLIFYFGKDPGETTTGGHTAASWHVIAYGMLRDTLLDYVIKGGAATTPVASPTIMDKADPCPPNCPK